MKNENKYYIKKEYLGLNTKNKEIFKRRKLELYLRLQYLTNDEISKELGIPKTMVEHDMVEIQKCVPIMLKAKELTAKRRMQNKADSKTKTIQGLVNKHYSKRQIMKELGISNSTINMYSNDIYFSNTGYKKICIICHKEFYTKDNRIKCCSQECIKKRQNLKSTAYKRMRMKDCGLGDKDISIENIIRKDGCTCALCGKPVNINDFKIINGRKQCGNNYPSIDHIIPISRGGSNTWDNVQLAHRICNTRKNNRV